MSDFAFEGLGESSDRRWESLTRQMDEVLGLQMTGPRPTANHGLDLNVTATTEEEPADLALARLIRHPAIILVLGHRGSGKSALACRLQELRRDVAPAYGVGLPAKASRLLPNWYGLADDPMDIPQNAIIYIPESYRLFHARASQTAMGRAIGELVNLSRHRRHTIIFDVQNPSHLDRNIISEADVVLVKEPGPMSRGFEQPQLRPIMDAARSAFAGVGPLRRKRVVWVCAPLEGEEGGLLENRLPSFWTSALSRVFGDVTPVRSGRSNRLGHGHGQSDPGKAAPRRGKRESAKARGERARTLKAQGYSYAEVGRLLGVGKSQAYRLVKQP